MVSSSCRLNSQPVDMGDQDWVVNNRTNSIYFLFFNAKTLRLFLSKSLTPFSLDTKELTSLVTTVDQTAVCYI